MHIGQDTQQRDDRRAHRKSVESTEPVINVITGLSMGHIGNMSRTGVMLIGATRPDSNAIYQIILPLPLKNGTTLNIEVGVQEQWHDQAASTDQYWVGYRIVAISDEDHARLQNWLELPE
ncbi:PilZ domain-containing protein [Oleiagrimonas soli]|uniref:PilZ domain-containing protein n=1 Tax=Oleiagrimonas soli TaxID=1543381 RepID=A0A099CV30_9GAMM|nr:PilZ domain-containing protein [Oleiagrimonas soli]KGI77818.1 hypothetical protein LF63_0105200 [Oleiagrimonas soli]MBB6183846.1 hypothetical protein [Oleiagrimonas soli]